MPDKAAAREKRFLQCEKCSSLCCHLCLKKFVTAMESQKIIQSEFWWMEYAKKVVEGKVDMLVPSSESHCCRLANDADTVDDANTVDNAGPTIKVDHDQARVKTKSIDGA
jgi:hypothetical protein